MKKILVLILISFYSTLLLAQPIIEGTYFPVRNTKIIQLFDTAATNLTLPSVGPDQLWDYSNQFVLSDTGSLWTIDPSQSPYSSFHPTSTHAVYSLSPRPTDNDKYSHVIIDTSGARVVGFEASSFLEGEFMIPNELGYDFSHQDTLIIINSGIYNPGSIPYIRRNYRFKDMNAIGYGSLITPISTYDNVMLIKEAITDFDSTFINLGAGYVLYEAPRPILTYRYNFMRNNTFATTYCMQLRVDSTDLNVDYGWYVMPTDIGSIAGTVNDTNGLAITSGEMILYREHSNYIKNDILASTTVDASGNYQFDSIPYGEYRVACRPNLGVYNNAMTTYVGNTSDWINCQTILTTSNSIGNDITLVYHPDQIGGGSISGSLNQDYSFSKRGNGDPIPGIDIIIEKTPTGAVNAGGFSGSTGAFSFTNLNDGDYRIFVDIPGLNMAGSYDFTISGGTTVSNLDFKIGFDSIHPIGLATTVEPIQLSTSIIKAYPNPFSISTTIELELKNNSNVEVNVFNMLGEQVDQLINSALTKGNHKFNFGAQNNASGIYFVKIKINGEQEVLKLIHR
jgi:hypothetical protein